MVDLKYYCKDILLFNIYLLIKTFYINFIILALTNYNSND